MRLPCWLLALASLSPAGAAMAAEVPAPARCVYDAAPDALQRYLSAERESPARSESAGVLQAAARQCATQYSWSAEQGVAAIQYAVARTVRERAIADLAEFNMDGDDLVAIADGVPEADVAAILSGNTQPLFLAFERHMSSSGIDLSRLTTDSSYRLGVIIGRGAGAVLLERRLVRQFQ